MLSGRKPNGEWRHRVNSEESSADSNNFPALASLPTPPDSSGARVLSSAQKTRNRRKRQLSKFLVIANEKGKKWRRPARDGDSAGEMSHTAKLSATCAEAPDAARPPARPPPGTPASRSSPRAQSIKNRASSFKPPAGQRPPSSRPPTGSSLSRCGTATSRGRTFVVSKVHKGFPVKRALYVPKLNHYPTPPKEVLRPSGATESATFPSLPSKTSIGVQATPCPWTRFYVNDQSKGSKHSHFKYFDVVNPSLGGAEVSSEFPGSLQLVDPLPEWASDMWERLYYIPLKAHPQTLEHGAAVDPASVNEWPKIHVASEDLLENVHEWDLPDKQLFSEEHTAQRLYLEDFCKYLSLLRPRSDLDHMPLAALRNGLLYYLASQMKSAAAFFEKRMEDRVKKLESLVDELLDQMREMTEVHKTEVSDMEDKHTEDSKLQLRVASHAAKFASAVIKSKASNAQREIEVAKAKLHALKSQLISLEAAKKKELQNAQQEADTLRAELEASRAAAETQHRADAGLLHAKDATCNSLTARVEQLEQEVRGLKPYAKLGQKAEVIFDQAEEESKAYTKWRRGFAKRMKEQKSYSEERIHKMESHMQSLIHAARERGDMYEVNRLTEIREAQQKQHRLQEELQLLYSKAEFTNSQLSEQLLSLKAKLWKQDVDNNKYWQKSAQNIAACNVELTEAQHDLLRRCHEGSLSEASQVQLSAVMARIKGHLNFLSADLQGMEHMAFEDQQKRQEEVAQSTDAAEVETEAEMAESTAIDDDPEDLTADGGRPTGSSATESAWAESWNLKEDIDRLHSPSISFLQRIKGGSPEGGGASGVKAERSGPEEDPEADARANGKGTEDGDSKGAMPLLLQRTAGRNASNPDLSTSKTSTSTEGAVPFSAQVSASAFETASDAGKGLARDAAKPDDRKESADSALPKPSVQQSSPSAALGDSQKESGNPFRSNRALSQLPPLVASEGMPNPPTDDLDSARGKLRSEGQGGTTADSCESAEAKLSRRPADSGVAGGLRSDPGMPSHAEARGGAPTLTPLCARDAAQESLEAGESVPVKSGAPSGGGGAVERVQTADRELVSSLVESKKQLEGEVGRLRAEAAELRARLAGSEQAKAKLGLKAKMMGLLQKNANRERKEGGRNAAGEEPPEEISASFERHSEALDAMKSRLAMISTSDRHGDKSSHIIGDLHNLIGQAKKNEEEFREATSRARALMSSKSASSDTLGKADQRSTPTAASIQAVVDADSAVNGQRWGRVALRSVAEHSMRDFFKKQEEITQQINKLTMLERMEDRGELQEFVSTFTESARDTAKMMKNATKRIMDRKLWQPADIRFIIDMFKPSDENQPLSLQEIKEACITASEHIRGTLGEAQLMVAHVTFDPTPEDGDGPELEDNPDTYDDNLFCVNTMTSGFPILVEEGDFLPMDPSTLYYLACNAGKEMAQQIGDSILKVIPVRLPSTIALKTFGSVWGIIAVVIQPELLPKMDRLVAAMRTGLTEAVIKNLAALGDHINEIEDRTAVQKMKLKTRFTHMAFNGANITELETEIETALQCKAQLEHFMFKNKQLGSMLAELKKSSVVSRPVLAVVVSTLLLLGETSLLPIFDHGIPTHHNGLKSAWLRVRKVFNDSIVERGKKKERNILQRMRDCNAVQVTLPSDAVFSLISSVGDIANQKTLKTALKVVPCLDEWNCIIFGIMLVRRIITGETRRGGAA
ncbi:hypothetical protein CYMTET_10350 [Cymbomonas tetramitiformis]|uniref:Uncharacterized protein n=1 Tax=Cymbomonas tetramitiformis TaxID=36881 RepID=A0AAE0GPE8_9CHLO|nr:hypothetical protein CYMTET_10350 [Cymbomonas tetramitiformis]